MIVAVVAAISAWANLNTVAANFYSAQSVLSYATNAYKSNGDAGKLNDEIMRARRMTQESEPGAPVVPR